MSELTFFGINYLLKRRVELDTSEQNGKFIA